MKTLNRFYWSSFLPGSWFSAPLLAQTGTVISDTDAAQQVGQKDSAERVVVEVTNSDNGNIIFGGTTLTRLYQPGFQHFAPVLCASL
jgi:hypothetical protein